ncbi:MAG: hypothetical protein ABR517_05240 [Thermoanaerobaculia bacterium]
MQIAQFLCLPLLALLAGCASSGPSSVIDGSRGGVPMAFGGAGLVDRMVTPPRAEMGSQVTVRFLFTNVSDRDQYVASLRVTQSSAGSTRLRIEPAGTKVDRTVEPGEDIEIDVRLTVYRSRPMSGEPQQAGVRLDTRLLMRDGTAYSYPIEIPVDLASY